MRELDWKRKVIMTVSSSSPARITEGKRMYSQLGHVESSQRTIDSPEEDIRNNTCADSNFLPVSKSKAVQIESESCMYT